MCTIISHNGHQNWIAELAVADLFQFFKHSSLTNWWKNRPFGEQMPNRMWAFRKNNIIIITHQKNSQMQLKCRYIVLNSVHKQNVWYWKSSIVGRNRTFAAATSSLLLTLSESGNCFSLLTDVCFLTLLVRLYR